MRRVGPIVTREDIPAVEPRLRDVSAVFNPGAVRYRGEELLLLRVQTRGRETVLMPARRTDRGVEVHPVVTTIEGLDARREGIYHVYDPRLTVIDDALVMVFAADVADGCRLGVARADSPERFTLLSLDRDGDRRNGALFPERIGGRYARLERPNREPGPEGVSSGDRVMLAFSDDLVTWDDRKPVFQGRPRYWDELVGAGPPPLRTEDGWLLFYHGVATRHGGANLYQMGAVLLDPDDPARVIGRTRENLLEPRESYELTGQVPGVVFPTGCIPRIEGSLLTRTDIVTVYYGAADTCVAAATTSVGRVLDACGPVPR